MRNYMNREHMLLPVLSARIKIILVINYEERADISYECQEKNNSNSTGM